MKNNIRQFCFPAGVAEASRLLAKLKGKALVVAGSTRVPRALAPAIESVVDISDLPLKHIKADKKWLRIGALCTIDDLENSPLLSRWAGGVIAKTAGFGSNAPARHWGTVGGNVVRPHPDNNLPPLFLALEAAAVCAEGGREVLLPFAELLKPEVMHRFGSRYLLTEIRVPAETKNWAAVSQRLADTKTDWEAHANCVVAADLPKKVSIAVSAVLPRAARMNKAEEIVRLGSRDSKTAQAAATAVVAELKALAPAKSYACEMAGVMVRRALWSIFQG